MLLPAFPGSNQPAVLPLPGTQVPVDLYVFHERNQGKLFSNCELLSIKLELMRGIGQAEADGETRAYRNYLYQANLFCKTWEQDHLSEESGETSLKEPLS